MPAKTRAAAKAGKKDSSASIGFEQKLWLAAEYKHVVLGRIYDPACGSGSMFVQSEKFVESLGGPTKCEIRSASVEV